MVADPMQRGAQPMWRSGRYFGLACLQLLFSSHVWERDKLLLETL